MKFPTVTQCCFCVDLKPAGYVLGVLAAVGGLLNVLKGAAIIPNLLTTALAILWLVGVFQERPAFMLPYVVLAAVGLIILYLSPILVIILVNAFPNNQQVQDIKHTFGDAIVVAVVFWLIIAALSTYFWIVFYSVYRYVKELVDGRGGQPKPQV